MSPKRSTRSATSSRRTRSASGRSSSRTARAGDHITLTKSPYYYDGRTCTWTRSSSGSSTDQRARAANLRSHDVDVHDRVHLDRRCRRSQRDSIAERAQVDVDRLPGDHDQHRQQERALKLPYQNVGTAPREARQYLRTAFELALDRKRSTRWSSAARTSPTAYPSRPSARSTPRPRASRATCTADVAAGAEARQALGLPDPAITVHLMLGTDPVAARLGQVIQAMEEQAGFNVVLEPTEFVTLAGQARTAASSTPSRSAGRAASTPTATSTGSSTTTGSQNDSRLLERRRWTVLNNARKAATLTARTLVPRGDEDHRQRDRPLIYLYHPVNRYAQSEEGRRRAGLRRRPDPRLQFAGFKK